MIDALKSWIVRRMLDADIEHMECDLAAIAAQRRNDIIAEEMIERELVIARRRRQHMIQDRINKNSAANVRRMGRAK